MSEEREFIGTTDYLDMSVDIYSELDELSREIQFNI